MANNSATLLRNDTAANWASDNPTLLLGEMGVEIDTRKIKVGDGTTAWNSLSYVGTGASFAYGRFTLSADQTTNLASTNPVKFDTVQGSINSLSNYTITLEANKTYKITFNIGCQFSANTGRSYFHVYNVTSSSYISDTLQVLNEQFTSYYGVPTSQEVIFTTTEETQIQLHIYNPTSLYKIWSNYGTRMLIEEYGGV